MIIKTIYFVLESKIKKLIMKSIITLAVTCTLYSASAQNFQMLKDINSSGGSESLFHDAVEYNGKLYFSANNGINDVEPWVTDGTDEGTQMLKNIMPDGYDGSLPYGFTVYNDKLYFGALNSPAGHQLWVTDGTEEGTQLFKAISDPKDFTVYNGKMYFQAKDGDHGTELWVTDGTASGTVLLKDIQPGFEDSNPTGFTVFDGKMVSFIFAPMTVRTVLNFGSQMVPQQVHKCSKI